MTSRLWPALSRMVRAGQRSLLVATTGLDRHWTAETLLTGLWWPVLIVSSRNRRNWTQGRTAVQCLLVRNQSRTGRAGLWQVCLFLCLVLVCLFRLGLMAPEGGGISCRLWKSTSEHRAWTLPALTIWMMLVRHPVIHQQAGSGGHSGTGRAGSDGQAGQSRNRQGGADGLVETCWGSVCHPGSAVPVSDAVQVGRPDGRTLDGLDSKAGFRLMVSRPQGRHSRPGLLDRLVAWSEQRIQQNQNHQACLACSAGHQIPSGRLWTSSRPDRHHPQNGAN